MGRISTKENKTVYQETREKLGLSRERAAELAGLEPYKIERIENEKISPEPWDVAALSAAYGAPHLCNYFCANECPIGKQHVAEIKDRDLSQVILEMLASLNSIKHRQERLIEITVDGEVENDELEDFIEIQKELERISSSVEALRLWAKKKIAEGQIDGKQYRELSKKK